MRINIQKIQTLKIKAVIAIMTGYFNPAIKHLKEILKLKEINNAEQQRKK